VAATFFKLTNQLVPRSQSPFSAAPSRGIVLVLVLVVIALLSLAGLSFSEMMLTERKAAQTSCRQAQARALAESGVEAARRFLDRATTDQDQAGGLYDNPQLFRSMLVVDDDVARNRGCFTVVAPRIEDRAVSGVRYGLEDESTRINLRTLLQADKQTAGNAKKMLMGLPGMTDAIADSILDWIDADDDPRPQGAEREYYGTLTPPYAPRNGVPVTLEELLLVRGVTPSLLFGADAARLALPGANSAGDDLGAEGVDNSDGSMNHGWAAYLTLYSAEGKLRSDGTPKIDLNGSDLQKLYDDLEQAVGSSWATFIVAYRQNGAQTAVKKSSDNSKPGSGDPKSGSGDPKSGSGGGKGGSGKGGASGPTGPGAQSGASGNQSGASGKQSGASGNQSGASGKQSGASGSQSGASGKQTGSGGNQTGSGGNQTGTGGNQSPTEASQAGTAAPAGKLDLTKKASTTLTSVLDLIGVRTTAKFEGQKDEVLLPSPFPDDRAAMSTYLTKLMDNTTVGSESSIPGRININQASRVVLMCLPGMTADIVDQIIAKRTPDPAVNGGNPDHQHETWLLTEGIVPLKTMKTLMPLVSAGGSVYRAQVIGHYDGGGTVSRLEVVIDATKSPARVLFWRDVTHSASGYPGELTGGTQR
jgi:DNA uptake protein ComE-like DNA-binding protein